MGLGIQNCPPEPTSECQCLRAAYSQEKKSAWIEEHRAGSMSEVQNMISARIRV